LEEIAVGPSGSKKYLQIGPNHSKHSKNSPKIPKKFPIFARALVLSHQNFPPLKNSTNTPKTFQKDYFTLQSI
jgi:hypothetical protein